MINAAFLFKRPKPRSPTKNPAGRCASIRRLEAAEAVPWTKPDELVYDSKAPLPKLGNHITGGFNVVFMDGSVRYFARPPDEQTMRALITHAGGEVIRLDR